MGVSVDMLDGGKTVTLTGVEKIQTPLADGGSCFWVPVPDFKLETKEITKDGVYFPEDDNCTGYSEVTVSAKQKKIKGKKKKGNKDVPIIVEVDDDGNLIETELPAYIKIEVLPDKLEYHDGEAIMTNGMLVKAYYADDSEWGIVPNNEISLDPTHATYSGGGGGGGKSSPLDTSPQVQPLPVNSYFRVGNRSTVEAAGYDYDIDGGNTFAWYHSEYGRMWIGVIIASDNPNTLCFRHEYRYGNLHSTSQVAFDATATYDGKTVYYKPIYTWAYIYEGGGVQVGRISDYLGTPNYARTAWTIVYGEASTGSETITVSWTPPDGEEELTDTFDIIPSN